MNIYQNKGRLLDRTVALAHNNQKLNTIMSKKIQFKNYTKEILISTLDLDELLSTQPGIFDFSKIAIGEKIHLIVSHPKVFLKFFDLSKLPHDEKSQVILNCGESVIEKLEITEQDLGLLSTHAYLKLLRINFDEYIRESIYHKLNRADQFEIFKINPKWVLGVTKTLPNFTLKNLKELVRDRTNLIDEYITDFSQYSTDYYLWQDLIEYKPAYKSVFLKNQKTCLTKTDIRMVFKKYPDLIKKLDKDLIENSKLTSKEWVLLIDSITKETRNKKVFANWKMSEELIEELKLGATVDILANTTTSTKRFKNALGKISADVDSNA